MHAYRLVLGRLQSANFESLCFKPIDGEGCLVESPSQYWLKDPVLLGEDPSPSLTASCQTMEPFLASRSPCMDKVCVWVWLFLTYYASYV